MPTATQVLLDEHTRIRAVLQPALAALSALEAGGQDALERHLSALDAWAKFSGAGLVAHATKEDEILFPAVEEHLGTTGGPTQVMRLEHREIHKLAQRFVETLNEIRDHDHPALMADVQSFQKALGRAQSGRGSAAEVRASLGELEEVLQSHFEKEERVLFPLVESLLPPETQQQVGTKLAEFPEEV